MNYVSQVSVSEGIFPPFDIVEVFASDADSGENGEVSYELVGYEPDVEKGQLFKVDPDSGLIRCHRELDRETLDRYTIKVISFFSILALHNKNFFEFFEILMIRVFALIRNKAFNI
jgi:hypothetical protein